MKKVSSKQELHQIEQLGVTIYLRKNIKLVTIQDDQGSYEEWQADEVNFEKENADLQKIHDNFELYWQWANEKMQKEELEKEKSRKVRQLVKENDLANLKEVVDQLVSDNLGGV